MRNRKRRLARSLGAIAVAASVVLAMIALARRSDSAVRPAGTRSDKAGSVSTPTPRLAAPEERKGVNDGVVDAARQFAVQFVTPELKYPASAGFPESSIRFERFVLMNFSTGDRIEHWFVDGGVDSKNDYGVVVRSRWRVMLGRSNDLFFPVVVSLEGHPVYQMRGHVEMLQDARRADQQQKEAQAAAKKATDLAVNRALWQANAAAKPDEQKASEALKMARDLLEAGRNEPARRRLQEIVEKFPGTSAAAEAEELLK